MKVNEIFMSLQGEGALAGVPMVFVRLQGCNLQPGCSWCDTVYAQSTNGGREMRLSTIVEKIRSLHAHQDGWVCITGGEPLAQPGVKELIRGLRKWGYRVEVETNGSIEPPLLWLSSVDSWVVDVKCPSSGVCGVSKIDEWFAARAKDQVKFVVKTEGDLQFVVDTLREHQCTPQVFVSPVLVSCIVRHDSFADRGVAENWDVDWCQRVAEFCKGNRLRMGLQLHKVVWGNKKGV